MVLLGQLDSTQITAPVRHPDCPIGGASLAFPTAFDIEHTFYRESCNTAASPKNQSMNKSESDRIQDLCARIAVEQDRNKFMKLVQELNRILSAEDGPMQNDPPHDREDD
jgi:hypothetical protein